MTFDYDKTPIDLFMWARDIDEAHRWHGIFGKEEIERMFSKARYDANIFALADELGRSE